MQAMRERERRHRLAGTVQVDDAYLGGEPPRRGSENETPVLVAVQVTDEGQPVLPKLSVLGRFRKVEVEQWARENLQPGTTVNTDGLGCFRGVEAVLPRSLLRAAALLRPIPKSVAYLVPLPPAPAQGFST